MKKESKEMFDLLKSLKLLLKIQEASQHINKFWHNTNDWWLNERTIKGRKFYLENFYSVKKIGKMDGVISFLMS